ncbi:MAG: hypothetical protein GX921_00665 [Bacteroidales bacterium]|nr:hypothetical protein [Bacteroidales bacterium]
MNSFGFIREACSVLGASFSDIAIFEDLVEYEPSKMDNSDKSIKELNDIAGGKYWQTIIQEYKMQKINGYEAESLFVQQYCMRLTKKYKYVLNMPLRIKRNQRPKYRLIHVTNHPSACLLMVDNICNRWQVLQEIQTGRQQQLFEEDYNNCIVDSDETKKMVTRHFSECSDWINLSEALAMFFIKHGPICKTGKIKEMLKQLEKQQRLDVRREPSKTTKGEPTSFMSESPKKSVHVRWCQ